MPCAGADLGVRPSKTVGAIYLARVRAIGDRGDLESAAAQHPHAGYAAGSNALVNALVSYDFLESADELHTLHSWLAKHAFPIYY